MGVFEDWARSTFGDTLYEVGEFVVKAGEVKQRLSSPLPEGLNPLLDRAGSPYTSRMKGGGKYYGGTGAPKNAYYDTTGKRGASGVLADATTMYSIPLRRMLAEEKKLKEPL